MADTPELPNPEDGGPKTEDGGPKTVDREEKTEVRGQRSEIRDQKPEVKDQGAGGPTVPPRPGSWAWPTAWMVTVFILVGGAVLVFKACYELPVRTVEKAGEVVEKIGQTLQTVAATLHQGTIHTSFTSYATTLSTTRYFQFTTLKQSEIFTRSDERTLGYIPLPEIVVEARAPIQYTYYFDLNGKWDFVLQDNVMNVYPPVIEFNQPAVDVSKIEYEVKKGLVGSDKVRDDLTRSISFLAREKARANIPLVQETGRKAVTDFVEKWLLRAFSDGSNYVVRVHFAGEDPAEALRVRKPE